MGTSKGYQAPSSPQWAELKGQVTRLAASSGVTTDQTRQVLGRFIQTSGGARSIAHGSSGGGGAAARVGSNLAGFASTVATRGLDQALREYGLEHLIGRTAGEVMLTLLDELCDDGSTLEEVDARQAMADLDKEILEGAQTYEEVRERLEATMRLDKLGPLLQSFFGHYLYHHFCRVFYERLVQRKGEQAANNLLGSVRNYIKKELEYQTLDRDLTKVDWRGREGRSIAADVMEQTLKVYGG